MKKCNKIKEGCFECYHSVEHADTTECCFTCPEVIEAVCDYVLDNYLNDYKEVIT